MALDTRLEKSFSALPVHSPRSYSKRGLDPRLARKFLQSSGIAPKERQQLITYITQSKWIPKERAVYGAVVDGFSTTGEIKTVTGLSTSEVDLVIAKLEKSGLLRRIT